MAGGLTWLDHLVVGIYLVSMLGMGFVIARRQSSTDDFFVAGRSLPAWAVGISIFASLLSTITYLGQPGEMFRTGIGYLTRQLPVPLVLVVVWFLWIPFFMRLSLTSAYEYLEKRYNYAVRALAAVFCLLLLFGWISVVVLTASIALAEITNLDLGPSLAGLTAAWSGSPVASGELPGYLQDVDEYVIIICVGLFSVIYTTMGGMRAVVWTDVAQFLVLLAGALFTMGAVAYMTNSGVGDWLAVSQAYKHEQVEWFDWDVRNRSTVFVISLNMFFWFICTHGANQVALQRYFSVKDAWEARKSYLVSAVVNIIIGVLLAGVGISLMYFIQHHDLPAAAHLTSSESALRNTAQDAVYPQFIRLYMPSGLRGLVVAALFAAAMSTIDSGANSAATILTVDFFRRLAPHRMSGAHELRRARLFTASLGLIVVIYTIVLYRVSKGTDIISLCQKGFNCFLGALGALFVLALFSRRSTAATVIPALLIGEVFGVVSSFWEELTAWGANAWGGWFAAQLGGEQVGGRYQGMPFSTHLVVPCAWLVTLLADQALALLLGARASPEQQCWMWRPVVRGELPSAAVPLPQPAAE